MNCCGSSIANPKESKWVLGGEGTRNNIIATPVDVQGTCLRRESGKTPNTAKVKGTSGVSIRPNAATFPRNWR